jgi:hypothetical protein
MKAYTVWVSGGRIGTYHTREKAEEIKRKVEKEIANLTRIQEWEPEEHHYPYVTFNDGEELKFND